MTALLTDLYQLTMANGYWKLGMGETEAVFHYFFRKIPFQGGFAVCCGLERLIEFVENYSFTTSELDYLATLGFERPFLDYLKELKLSLTLDAMPEGTPCFPFEPVVRVQGPLIHCQLMETPLLNLMNFPTLIATKGARIKLAAASDAVLEFGLRRAQGIDGGLTASRAAYVGGIDATSNLQAGMAFGIPVSGTQAHSWIMAFENELESFKGYAQAFPGNCVLLVDTFDSLEGVRHAIEVGKILARKGEKLVGIRLDSGDLAKLSIESRRLLDQAGFPECQIYGSSELDETSISDLKNRGAKITFWGVGTSLATGQNSPYLDGVYKLSAVRERGEKWNYKLKLSEQMQKISNPGILQTRRYVENGVAKADVIYDVQMGIDGKEMPYEDLLKPIFVEGKRVYQAPPLGEIRRNTLENLARLPEEVKRLVHPQIYPVSLEKRLERLKMDLIEKVRVKSA